MKYRFLNNYYHLENVIVQKMLLFDNIIYRHIDKSTNHFAPFEVNNIQY